MISSFFTLGLGWCGFLSTLYASVLNSSAMLVSKLWHAFSIFNIYSPRGGSLGVMAKLGPCNSRLSCSLVRGMLDRFITHFLLLSGSPWFMRSSMFERLPCSCLFRPLISLSIFLICLFWTFRCLISLLFRTSSLAFPTQTRRSSHVWLRKLVSLEQNFSSVSKRTFQIHNLLCSVCLILCSPMHLF